MGTNCTHLVADLFLCGYEKDFMISLTRGNQADIIEAFNSISRYFDGLLNIANVHLELMVDRIYPAEVQLNKANSSDTEAPFSGLNSYIIMIQFPLKFMTNGTISILILFISRSMMALRSIKRCHARRRTLDTRPKSYLKAPQVRH